MAVPMLGRMRLVERRRNSLLVLLLGIICVVSVASLLGLMSYRLIARGRGAVVHNS